MIADDTIIDWGTYKRCAFKEVYDHVPDNTAWELEEVNEGNDKASRGMWRIARPD